MAERADTLRPQQSQSVGSTAPQFEFSTDWFSGHVPIWEKHLLHLQDCGCKCLEIGTFEGQSAVWIAKTLLTHPQSELICVDPAQSPEVLARWERNIQATGRASQVTLVCRRSQEFLPTLTDRFDLIYIDGDHHAAAVILDACNAWPLLKTGGILVFDDYGWTWEGYGPHQLPRPAIDFFLSLYPTEMQVLEMGYQVIVQRLNSSSEKWAALAVP